MSLFTSKDFRSGINRCPRMSPPILLRKVRKSVGLASFLIIAAIASGTSVQPPEFSDLVNQSDYIVRGRVKSVTPKLEQTERGRKIYTWVAIEVQEVIAGVPPHPLVLVLLGGKVGKDEMIVEGVPVFHVGDDDILFVQGNGRQMYPLVALMHGRYPILSDPTTARQFMVRSNKVPLQDTSEVSLPMTEGTAAEMQLRLKSTTEALTPSEFILKIKAAVKPGNSRLRER